MGSWRSRSLILFCVLWAASMQQAWAVVAFCTLNRTTVTTPALLPTTLLVPRDVPDGYVLYDSQWIVGTPGDVSCGGFLHHGPLSVTYGFMNGTSVPGFSDVYPTKVPGVGVKVAWSRKISPIPPNIEGGQFMTSPVQSEPLNYSPLKPTQYTPASHWRFQLIKTGNLASGDFSIPPVRVFYGNALTNVLEFSKGSLAFNTRGCSLRMRDQTVSLDKSWPKDFRGIGSTTRPKDFDIKLDCEPSVRITYQIDGVRVDGSTLINTGMGNTESKSLADGVGIQLLLRHGAGGPLPMGSEITLGNSAASGPSGLQIPLTAQYKQVGATITPGFVGALATITLFYR
ncbi:fimbrial protein [Metapseudomonas otitidis]|uniref:fimbrial protein n=1 Tax=Metapseudomonas otitidis TaxID=319939 RepID=UPI0020968FFF|nr:fimbrial protein [Pseudomonas otitidis]MCO7555993.1 fimbrial protein [Pseudomonas otitidis]